MLLKHIKSWRLRETSWLHCIQKKESEGAFSHRAHAVQAQRAHSARTAPVIMLFILEKPLKTTNLHRRA